jgi:DNA topoisomerase-1
MAPAKIANKTVEITAGDYELKTGTSKILFDGFLKLYKDNEEEAEAKIPDLSEGDKLKLDEIIPIQ